MTRSRRFLQALVLAFTPVAALAEGTTVKLGPDQIDQAIVTESVLDYIAHHGSCPCEWSTNAQEELCGAVSANAQPGGEDPTCTVAEVTNDQRAAFKKRFGPQ